MGALPAFSKKVSCVSRIDQRDSSSSDAARSKSWPHPPMRLETLLVMLMCVVLAAAALTAYALWNFQIRGYLWWPFG